MKDPHQISSAYILDPAYSKSARLPAAPGSSLYGGQPGSSQWLYGVGDVAAFLASPLGSGITGTTIYVDKGYHAMGKQAPEG